MEQVRPRVPTIQEITAAWGLSDMSLHAIECEVLRAALIRTQGNRAHAARALGISIRGMSCKLERHGLKDFLKGPR